MKNLRLFEATACLRFYLIIKQFSNKIFLLQQ